MSKLSESLMIDIRDTITMFDKNGDGKLSIDDIVNALRALDLNPGSNDWNDVIQEYRNAGVTRVDIEQFASIFEEERNKNQATYEVLVEGLKALDPINGECGLVNRAVLLRYLSVLGDSLDEKDADKLLAECVDKKGAHVMIDKIVKMVMGDWREE